MTVIFDENVPWPLSHHFTSHTVTSVQREGWSGIQNGALIEKIDERFDVFLLADKNLRYQQNLTDRNIAIVELPTNRWPHLEAMLPQIAAAIERSRPGNYEILEL
jgi:hypothetical protein